MINLQTITQIVIAVSVTYVWVFRFHNLAQEFTEYQLNDTVRSLVGAVKISVATLLVAGIWYPGLVRIPALVMAFLMFFAQIFHSRTRHPLLQRLPSFLLMVLSLFVAWSATA